MTLKRRKCNRNDCLYKDQEEFWLRFSMIPIYNSENELSHWVSIQRDVTEERNQEKEKNI
jgi:PAS domain-containing protein